MSFRVFLSLLVVTVIATAAAVIVAFEQPTAAPVRYVDEPAFPELRAGPDAVAKVELTTPDSSFTLVRETGERWSALERYGYPVEADKVRALIVALADMRLIEAKTTSPERYARLEVEDPESGDAKSRLLRVESADGTVLAVVILGKRQRRLTGNQSEGTYLRRPGEAQSWLASGGVDLDTAVTGWLDSEIVDLDPARIGRIRIQPETGEGYVVQRDAAGAPLRLAGLAEGEKPKEDADLGRLAGAFAGLRLEEVKPRPEVDWPAAHATAVAASFDGIEVTVQLAKLNGEPWALFDARPVEPLAPPQAAEAPDEGAAADVEEVEIAPEEDAAPDAATLAARLEPWAFKISSQVYDRLTKPRSDWLADPGTS